MRTFHVVPMLMLLAAAPFAGAQAADFPRADLEKLVAAGVGEEVLMAWVDSLPDYERLEADEIVQLMERKVPQKVIAAAVRKGGRVTTQVVSRYEVPGTGTTTRASSRVVDDSDYVQARQEYTVKDRTTYVYSQPTATYAVYDSSPYYYSSYYPYYNSYYSYPRSSFYFSYGSPYYSSRYYGSRYHRHHHHHRGHSHNYYRGGTRHSYHSGFTFRGTRRR